MSKSNAIAVGTLRWMWNTLRASLAVVLLIFEPIIRVVLGGFMVLGIIASILFEMSAAAPRFPFLKMMGFSLGCGVLLLIYYGLVSVLVVDKDD